MFPVSNVASEEAVFSDEGAYSSLIDSDMGLLVSFSAKLEELLKRKAKQVIPMVSMFFNFMGWFDFGLQLKKFTNHLNEPFN